MDEIIVRKIPRSEGGGVVRAIDNPDVKTMSNGKIFSTKFSNTALIARKASGKTSTIYWMLKKLCNKHTIVILICPSHNGDFAYQTIKEYLDDKDIPYFAYYNMNDIDNGDSSDEDNDEAQFTRGKSTAPKMTVIDALARHLRKKSTQWDNDKRTKTNYVIIIDDQGSETRNYQLANIMRRNRHCRANVILSVQNPTDILPSAICQLDNCLISRGTTPEKLEHIYKLLDLPIEYDKFARIYDTATAIPYKFLNIDVRKNKYRQSFENEIIF